jgi:hypothetical protein
MLWDRLEEARKDADLHGITTSLQEVLENVSVALDLLEKRLRPMDEAETRSDIAWLSRRISDWNAEQPLLRDEINELKRLRDHIKVFFHP